MDVDIILKYENLVRSIVNNYRGYYDIEDLYQVGMMGLVNAYKHFDSNMNVKFSTYAYTYVFGEVNKYIRENNNLKLSKDTIKLKRQIEKTKDIMRQKLFREPTTLELSLFLEIDEEKILEIEGIKQETKSLDYISDDDSNNLYNSIRVDDKNMSADIMDLKDELNNLTDEEKKLIYSRYYDGITQTELSKSMGISQVQVYRKEAKVLKKLNDKLCA